MPKTATITVRIDEDLKQSAERVLKTLGVNTSQAITMLYKQIELRQGLPFPVRIPNDQTRKALDHAVSGTDQDTFASLDELYADLGV